MKNFSVKYIIVIIVSIIIGGSILGYLYLDFEHKKEGVEKKTSNEDKSPNEKVLKKIKLQSCLDEINKKVASKLDGKNNMSTEEVEIVSDIAKKEQNECFKKYQ